jgi:hypothetical protein
MVRRTHTLWTVCTLLAIACASLLAGRPAVAQGTVLCFPNVPGITSCIEGRFRQYWEQNGGLAVFGYPITPARQEVNRDTGRSYLTQWFERNRFELHPELQRPYDVLLGRLGDDRLLQIGRDWRREYQPLRNPDCDAIVTDGKTFSLCEPFRTYYRTHGLEFDGHAGFSNAESLALFGLPLTQPAGETNASGDRVLTQWFERARFEDHPNNQQPYRVLLGLLGNEVSASVPAPGGATVTYAAQDGGVYEIRGGGQMARIGTATNLGKVLDAVRRGDQVTLLHEQGLQRLTVGGSATTIATFTRGNARFGALIASANTSKILYNYNRDGDTQSGFTGIMGVIEGTSARKVSERPNQMLVLGLSLDERMVYVVDWGGDPAIGRVRVVSLDDGRDLAAVTTENGYAAAALSPYRNIIAIGVQRPERSANEVAFYEVFNDKHAAPRTVTLPRPSWNVAQFAWAPDGSVVYALAYPATARPQGELWRIDPTTRRAEQVAGSLPSDLRIIVSPETAAPFSGRRRAARWWSIWLPVARRPTHCRPRP